MGKIENNPADYVFFGTDEFAVAVLDELNRLKLPPALIITTPDQPKGRKQVITPPPVKLWAKARAISCEQPGDLVATTKTLGLKHYALSLIASYGKILPHSLTHSFTHGVLNIHPSLLPKYRGPSPIQMAIINGEKETGVSLMVIDEEVDHGPILKMSKYNLEGKSYSQARDDLARIGAGLFKEALPTWLAGTVQATPQEHPAATFTKKIKKSDGLVNLGDNPSLNYRKFLAFTPWPSIFFFTGRSDKEKRVIITGAELNNAGQFIITRVRPEGRKDMSWADYQRGL